MVEYRVPKQYLQGGCNASVLLFWDTLYYLFATQGRDYPQRGGIGRRLESLTNPKLAQIMGLKERTLHQQRASQLNQTAPYLLQEEEGGEKHSFNYICPQYHQLLQKNVYTRPIQLHTHGWLTHLYHTVNSRFPLVLLNAFLAQPIGKRQCSLEQLRLYARKEKKLPEWADIYAAMAVLEQLQLVRRVDDRHYCLEMQTILQRTPTTLFPDTSHEWLAELQATHPFLAELAEMGNLSLADHGREMVRDLAFVQSPVEEMLLQTLVRRQRANGPHPRRWQKIWRTFCQLRQQKGHIHATPKTVVHFAAQTQQRVELSFPGLDDGPGPVRWIKLIISADKRSQLMLSSADSLHCTVVINDQEVWAQPLNAETPLRQPDLTAYSHSPFSCQVILRASRLLPRFQLQLQLQRSLYSLAGLLVTE